MNTVWPHFGLLCQSILHLLAAFFYRFLFHSLSTLLPFVASMATTVLLDLASYHFALLTPLILLRRRVVNAVVGAFGCQQTTASAPAALSDDAYIQRELEAKAVEFYLKHLSNVLSIGFFLLLNVLLNMN